MIILYDNSYRCPRRRTATTIKSKNQCRQPDADDGPLAHTRRISAWWKRTASKNTRGDHQLTATTKRRAHAPVVGTGGLLNLELQDIIPICTRTIKS